MTPAQLATLNTDISNNTATVSINGSSVQIKDVVKTPDNAVVVQAWAAVPRLEPGGAPLVVAHRGLRVCLTRFVVGLAASTTVRR